MSDSNYHTKTNRQSVRKLNFEDEDSPLVIVEQPEPISIDISDKIYANIEEEVIPKLGIEFETEQDAYDFYNNYACVVRFSIRRSKGHKGDKDGSRKWLDRVFCCSCEGILGNDKRDDNVKCHRPETRCGCLAEMKISCRYSEKYCVVKFVSEHTHVLASPHKRIFLRSQRSINLAQAIKAELADSSGIAPRASVGLMARRVDLDDLITNIFWADGGMKLDYEYFGDVVCFDTTYKKNREGRLFALFVGVNHHKQTIIFGAALLYDETSETFMWLFDSFQKTMFGKKPQTILTNQDAAIAKALASQWPKTHHRLCVRHMYQNAAKNLKEVFGRYNTFVADFSSCVYDHDYEDDFLDAWDNMLDKYYLKNNSWLQRQFELREKWALVYGRKTFCGYVYYSEKLVDDRRFEELRADFKATQSKPSLEYPVEILKHVASVYTPAIFKLFNRELWLTWDCELHKDGEVGFVVSFAHQLEKSNLGAITVWNLEPQTEKNRSDFSILFSAEIVFVHNVSISAESVDFVMVVAMIFAMILQTVILQVFAVGVAIVGWWGLDALFHLDLLDLCFRLLGKISASSVSVVVVVVVLYF
ncbi:protein FAR1-RELATED SEQUENCE 5-like [Castanea sativa]|uniref:protein FAR1-RELATED SEQUENCE 5-like n=1 Tax=Castanea sativa TaxID=21020 RepID=UPI003F64F583